MKPPPVSITVAIPAYNEEQTVEHICQQVLKALKNLTKDYELLLVDDGSTDNTGQIMERLAKRDHRIRVIHHTVNKGFSGAIAKSLFSAKKEFVFLGPADGQFNFAQITKFIRAIKNHDVVVAHRIINPEPLIRKIQSKIYHILAALLFGIRLKEFTTVSLWRTSILKGIRVVSDPKSNTAQIEIVYRVLKKGGKFAQVPIRWHPRRGGKAKGGVNPALILSTLDQIWKLYLRTRTQS